MSRIQRPKVKIGISLDAELYEWLRRNTGVGNEFASISHAIERTVARYQAEALKSERHEGPRGPGHGHHGPPPSG